MPECLGNMATPADGLMCRKQVCKLLRSDVGPLKSLVVRSQERRDMIKMMKPSKALVAKNALSSFIPIRHNVPDQAVLRIALNLPQTLLTAIAALRPARTLFQVEGRVPGKNRCCGALCCHIYSFLGKRLRTGYESL